MITTPPDLDTYHQRVGAGVDVEVETDQSRTMTGRIVTTWPALVTRTWQTPSA